MTPAIPRLPRLPDEVAAYREPLGPPAKRTLVALVIFFHVGAGWALTRVEPAKLVIGDIAPMSIRMVAADQPSEPLARSIEPAIENAEPPPPVELKPPDLAAIVDPPPPDLPPPEFPIAKLDIPPPEDTPPPVRPVERRPERKPVEQAKPAPRQPAALPAPSASTDAQQQQQATSVAPAAQRIVSAAEIGYLVRPAVVYPPRSRRAGEQGEVVMRVQIDASGRPGEVVLKKSSGYPALDEAAMAALRAAQFRPYVEGGVARSIWIDAPIKFELK